MAVISFVDGHKEVAKPATGLKIWEVLNGEREGSEDEQELCSQIKRLCLDWRTAPDSYVQANFDAIVHLHFGDWMCDDIGRLTRPDPARPGAVAFADKWGLMYLSIPTALARKHLQTYRYGRN